MFEAAGPLEWAILAPIDAPLLFAHVLTLGVYAPHPDDDDTRTWHVVQGAIGRAALIETEPGSIGGERDVAAALATVLGAAVYAVGFAGYDDPDLGVPFIEKYERGGAALLWSAADGDDDAPAPPTVAGPPGVPCDDPFDFAEALGVDLRDYYES